MGIVIVETRRRYRIAPLVPSRSPQASLSGAGRVFWTYGPDKGEITVLAVEPHPEDKKL
jgi:hypothetical protein